MPTFTNKKNLAVGTVHVAPAPPLTGQVFECGVGQGTDFPDEPFWLLLWPGPASAVQPVLANAEMCFCTDRTGDVFTVDRHQGGTTAKPIAIGWQIFNCIPVEDIEALEKHPNAHERILADRFVRKALHEYFSN